MDRIGSGRNPNTFRRGDCTETTCLNVYNAYLIFRLSDHGTMPALKLGLLTLLRLTTTFKTSEKLDTVFGLLGLIREDGNSTTECKIVVTTR